MKSGLFWNLGKMTALGILICAAAVIGFRYLLPPAAPFILAMLVASFIRPAALWCKKHLGIGAGPVSVVLILLILALVCMLIYSAGSRLVSECAKFLVNITETSASPDSPLNRLIKIVEDFGEKLSLSESGGVIDLYTLTTGLINTGAAKLSAALASWAGSLISSLPSAIFAFAICFIALLYLTLDYDGAVRAAADFLPQNYADKIRRTYRRISRALGEYLHAYLLIMFVTFGELYLGFTLLRIEYALLFAVVIALVDFLPLLGVGTVLIPWGAAALLLGDVRLGVGLLILYAIVCVIRQLIEPRIVGNFIGTHPVIALAGVYIGLKLFGVAGMIAAPIILYLVKALKES